MSLCPSSSTTTQKEVVSVFICFLYISVVPFSPSSQTVCGGFSSTRLLVSSTGTLDGAVPISRRLKKYCPAKSNCLVYCLPHSLLGISLPYILCLFGEGEKGGGTSCQFASVFFSTYHEQGSSPDGRSSYLLLIRRPRCYFLHHRGKLHFHSVEQTFNGACYVQEKNNT